MVNIIFRTLDADKKDIDFSKDFYAQEEIRLIARRFSGYFSPFLSKVLTFLGATNLNPDGQKLFRQEGVRFFVTPELSESRNVTYTEISDIRQPGGILIYLGTPARTYQINARMVSRTQEEADLTFYYTHLLKSWTVPQKDNQNFGSTGGQNAPEVVKLYGYDSSKQLRGVPVVLTSLNIEYPNNVNYISASNGALVPIIQSFSIGLKEARNQNELISGTGPGAFDLEKFKRGILPNW